MRADNPSHPSNPRVQVRILACPLQGNLVVTFLGPIYGTLLHQTDRASFPCLGDECPQIWHSKRRIWKGFAPAEAWDEHGQRWHPVGFEVTGHLEEQLRGRRLRGEVWLVERAPSRLNRGAVLGTFLESLPENKTSPTWDIRLVIARRYHLEAVPSPVPNPIVPRLTVEPVNRPAPILPHQVDPHAAAEAEKATQESIRELLRKRPRFLGGTGPSDQDQAEPGQPDKAKTNGEPRTK